MLQAHSLRLLSVDVRCCLCASVGQRVAFDAVSARARLFSRLVAHCQRVFREISARDYGAWIHHSGQGSEYITAVDRS